MKDKMAGAQEYRPMGAIDAIIDHLRAIVSKDRRGQTSSIRLGFEELAGKRSFTPAQMRAVFTHASETGKTEVNGYLSQMWPFFHDGFSKITMSYESLKPDQRVQPLLDAMVLSRWNAQNFPKVLGFDVPKNVPSYPAPLSQLGEFRLVPAYIEQSVMPPLKEALADHMGIDIPSLGRLVAEREGQLIQGGIPGYEALKPIENWPQGKKGTARNLGGPEVKAL